MEGLLEHRQLFPNSLALKSAAILSVGEDACICIVAGVGQSFWFQRSQSGSSFQSAERWISDALKSAWDVVWDRDSSLVWWKLW